MKGCLKFFAIAFTIIVVGGIFVVTMGVMFAPEIPISSGPPAEKPIDPKQQQDMELAQQYTARLWKKNNDGDAMRFLGDSTVEINQGLPSLEPRKTAMRLAGLYAQQLNRVPTTAVVMDGKRELASHTFSGPLLVDSLKIRDTQRLLLDHPVIGWSLEQMTAKYGPPQSYNPATYKASWPAFTVEIFDNQVQDIAPPARP